jgi:hypothetical protein
MNTVVPRKPDAYWEKGIPVTLAKVVLGRLPNTCQKPLAIVHEGSLAGFNLIKLFPHFLGVDHA